MLHCGSRNLYFALVASAFASAAWGQSAANPAGSADGFQQLSECGQLAASGSTGADMEEALFTRLESVRRDHGVSGLTRLASLDAAARLEARAVLGQLRNSAVGDPAGSLVDPVRVSERQHLLSAFGTSIVVVGAGSDVAAMHAALADNGMNRENMLRRNFDHAGIAIVDAGARKVVVQVFAKVDGAFEQPLPERVSSRTDVRAVLKSADMHPVGWSLEAVSGEVIARGRGTRIGANYGLPMEGYLNLDVAVGPEIHTLRGPYVKVVSN